MIPATTTPLAILGTTSSGKTSLSLQIAGDPLRYLQTNKPVDILVIDSKQVYIGQDIVTGKDIPPEFLQSDDAIIPSHLVSGDIRMFGLNLVNPDHKWSLAHFIAYAETVLAYSTKNDHHLLFVVGTPQYFFSLKAPPASISIKPDGALRKRLEFLGVDELQEELNRVNPWRLEQMNESDRMNPRRLVRAIEVGDAIDETTIEQSVLPTNMLGILVDSQTLELSIQERVKKRLEMGAIEEYLQLKANYPGWRNEARMALGYQEIENYVHHKDLDVLVAEWTLHELQYAKRQMTWLRSKAAIVWVSKESEQFEDAVRNQLTTWYT